MFQSFEKLSEEKRNFILNTCMDAFIEKGYAMANTVEMAKNCKIAKGSLFHYFGSKKNLFLYLVRMSIERVMSETTKSLSNINDDKYFDRVRKSMQIKMMLLMKFPKETNLISRAFSEKGHEAEDELSAMGKNYAAKMRELNSKYIGEIEKEFIREGVALKDARNYIKIVFDGITTHFLLKYKRDQKELLNNPEILKSELEKAIDFILKGIGK